MTDDQRFMAVGAYLYGALALIGVFALGIYMGDAYAAAAAIVAAGAAYVSQYVAVYGMERVALLFTAISAVSGLVGLVKALP